MVQGCVSSLREATPIVLTPEERAELENLARSTKTEHRTRFKAGSYDGDGRRGDAGDWPRAQVHDWDGRRNGECATRKIVLPAFPRPVIAGLRQNTARRPASASSPCLIRLRRSGPLIAKALGDVHVQYIWRFLRAHKIDLSGRKSWCVSNDPEFAAKAAEIVDNAVVLAAVHPGA